MTWLTNVLPGDHAGGIDVLLALGGMWLICRLLRVPIYWWD